MPSAFAGEKSGVLALLFFKFQNLLKSACQKVGSVYAAFIFAATCETVLKLCNAVLHQFFEAVDRLFGGGDGLGWRC